MAKAKKNKTKLLAKDFSLEELNDIIPLHPDLVGIIHDYIADILIIPLEFWFTKDTELAHPHPLNIKFEKNIQ